MNQNSEIKRDTIKTIRRRINQDTVDNLGYNVLINAPDTNNLVVLNSSTEASSDLVKPSMRIIAKMNSHGEMSYIYLDANGDTIMIDTPFVEEATDTEPMINTVYPSDTIQPSSYQFGDMSKATVQYPSNSIYRPYKMSNDDIVQAVYLPFLILMTVSFLYKSVINGAWTKLFVDVREAWIG
jgi:hypothetical protein